MRKISVEYAVLLIVFITMVISCKSVNTKTNSTTRTNSAPDSIFLSIHALDLTEDMSAISSKHDELTLLVYEVSDSAKFLQLVYSASFILTREGRKQVSWANSSDLVGKTYSIVLLERDTDQSTDEIENAVRNQYVDIEKHFLKQGNFGIENYLGDNDILGIKKIETLGQTDKIDFELRGFFKLDKFEYLLRISKNEEVASTH